MNLKELTTALVAVARAAYNLADNTEENATTGEMTIGFPSDFRELDFALTKLDDLPDPPGEAATGPRKAEYFLSTWFGLMNDDKPVSDDEAGRFMREYD